MKVRLQITNWMGTKLGFWFSHLFLICTFAIPDVWLRAATRWIGAYSIYELAPNLFTLLWAAVLTISITTIPSRKWGRIFYGTTYVKNGVVQWNNGMTEEKISEMNAYVQQVYQVNDAILDSDYYAG